jgi:hypothetical protein
MPSLELVAARKAGRWVYHQLQSFACKATGKVLKVRSDFLLRDAYR